MKNSLHSRKTRIWFSGRLSFVVPLYRISCSLQSQLQFFSCAVQASEAQTNLIKHLFLGYDRFWRPVIHENETVKINFSLILNILVSVVSMTVLIRVRSERKQTHVTKKRGHKHIKITSVTPRRIA